MKGSLQSHACATRGRLLETAGRLFARKGFRGATVRDICKAARANVAAVNYHFGGKSGLYTQAIRYWAEIAGQRHRFDAGIAAATPEQRLRVFVLAFMRRLLDEDRPSWHGWLIARELAEPTRALDGIVRDFYRPTVRQLQAILGELTGRRPDEGPVRMAAFSILGQCLYYHHARQVIPKLAPDIDVGRDVERIADHITRFSLAALRPVRRSGRGDRS